MIELQLKPPVGVTEGHDTQGHRQAVQQRWRLASRRASPRHGSLSTLVVVPA